jgi:uncharacterized membrane protein YczE
MQIKKELMKLIKNIFSIRSVPILSWSSRNSFNLKPKLKTFIFLTFGLFLFGLGETILIASSQGVSPWTVFAQGISKNTNFSIGLATFLMSVTVLLLWIPLKQRPGIGTVLNAIIISIVLDYSYPYLPQPNQFFFQIIQSFIGVIIVGIGSGFYLISNLGPGPRDGLMTGLQKLTKFPIFFVRGSIEIIVVFIGWKLGGIVGAGTIIFAVFVGPSVSIGFIVVKTFFK